MKLISIIALWIFSYNLFIAFSLITMVKVKPDKNQTVNLNPIIEAKVSDIDGASDIKPPSKISPNQDIRITALNKFLRDYHSPLADYAEEIVKQADLNGIDYAIIPAISMQESLGCKAIPADSYNCWGYGIYGTKLIKFSSYKEAIAQVTKTVKESYIKNGLTNPTLVEDRWTPSSKGQWSYAVNYFFTKIKEIEKNIPAS